MVAKVRVVENVVRVPADLEVDALLDGEVFVERHVHAEQARSPDGRSEEDCGGGK